jgi:hypothetical protein
VLDDAADAQLAGGGLHARLFVGEAVRSAAQQRSVHGQGLEEVVAVMGVVAHGSHVGPVSGRILSAIRDKMAR